MATKKTTPRYSADKQYQVELAEKVTVYGQDLYPGHDVVLRGDVLETIDAAAIVSATEQEEA